MRAALFAVLAGLCWGVGEVFTKSVLHSRRVGPITAIAVRSTIALPILWIAYIAAVHGMKLEPRDWFRADWPTMLKLILGSGLVAGAFGMLFFYSSLHLGEVSKTKPIAFTVAPAVAVMLGILVLGEEVTVRKVIAVCLVMLGVVMLTWR